MLMLPSVSKPSWTIKLFTDLSMKTLSLIKGAHEHGPGGDVECGRMDE